MMLTYIAISMVVHVVDMIFEFKTVLNKWGVGME
jgi:hypothetical protein